MPATSERWLVGILINLFSLARNRVKNSTICYCAGVKVQWGRGALLVMGSCLRKFLFPSFLRLDVLYRCYVSWQISGATDAMLEADSELADTLEAIKNYTGKSPSKCHQPFTSREQSGSWKPMLFLVFLFNFFFLKVESSSPGRCTHVVFVGKILNSHSASPHPGV